jgi:hypothetical protein
LISQKKKQSGYRNFGRHLLRWLSAETFFQLIVAGLVLQALWIAFSGRYPMAFDENFHLGIIHIYAHHLSPFLSSQPAGADAFGAVARDPSYLYQYLMSFPDRLITTFTHSQTAEVLILRFINIAMFASALPFFRKLLLKTGASKAVVHTCLLIFILVPIVPLLAAQINYDNLVLPVTAIFLLLTLNFSEELRDHKRLSVQLLAGVLIVGLLGSLVKYAFLPIFAAALVYIAFGLEQSYSSWRKFGQGLLSGVRLLTQRMRWLALIGLVIACGLFAQRDGVNLVSYHTPIPACNKVLTIQQCAAYGPWERNYNDAQGKTNASASPVTFTRQWFGGMWLRSVFAVDGPGTNFETRGPLLLPALITIIGPAVAILAVIVYGRRVLKKYNGRVIGLLALVSVFYIGALWLDNYADFVQTGQPVAINGRYLIPVLLPLLVIGGLAVNEALRKRPLWRAAIMSITILWLLWGGGALTYILRNNDAWLWPNQAVRDANHAVQHILGPITPGYHQPTEFL